MPAGSDQRPLVINTAVSPAVVLGALAAYATVPERERAELEAGEKWAAWIEWLRQSRQHGGFEVE
jgi:hypothetical protein